MKENKKKGPADSLIKKCIDAVNNVGLRKKMLLIFVCAIVVPVIAFGIFYFHRTKTIVKEQAKEQLTTQVRQYVQELNSMFFTVEEISSLLSFDTELSDKISKTYDSLLDAREVYLELWDQYKNIVNNWSYIRNVTIYFHNEQLSTDHPYFVSMDDYMNEAEALQFIKNNKSAGYWSGIKYSEESREYWYPHNSAKASERSIAYSRMMGYSYYSDVSPSILVIEVYENELKNRLNLADSAESEIFLLDSMGEIVISTAEREVLEALPGFLEMEPFSEDWDMIVKEDKYNIAVYGTLDNGWRLVGSMSLKKAMEPQQEMIFTGALFLAGASIVSLILIVLFSVSFSNRVNRMAGRMEHFMDGSFHLDEPVGGKDEIGQVDAKFTTLANQLVDIINEQYIMKLQREKARLEVLQTQVNPHFLYNALSTIGWLARKDQSLKTSHAVEALAKFYQINLSKGLEIIELSREFECLEAYLEIQRLRYPNRIYVYYELDDILSKVMIPKLTIQALVENSIQHGMAGEKETISILIHSAAKEDKACITIQDDGLGMKEEQLIALRNGTVQSAKGNGIGFINIHRRIQLQFGEEYGLEISSEEGAGTKVEVYLPINL